MPDFIIATLDDIELRTQTIEDDLSNTNVRHELVGRNGAIIEPMGQNATVFKMRVFFMGEDSIAPFVNFPSFLDLIKENRIMELNHPVFGIVDVAIDKIGNIYNNRKDTAEVVLELVQHTAETRPVFVENVVGATEKSFVDSMVETYDKIVNDIEVALELDSGGVLEVLIDAGETIGEAFSDFTGATREFISVIDNAVSGMQSTLAGIVNPANSLVGSIDFLTDLPGTLLKSIAQTAERYEILYEDIIDSPESFVQSFQTGLLTLETTLGVTVGDLSGVQTDAEINKDAAKTMISNQIKIVGAMTSSKNVATAYDNDETKQSEITKRESEEPIDVLGNYNKPEPLEFPLSIDDIEASLAAQQSYAQEAVNVARNEVRELKTATRILKRHVDMIKLEREQIITITVDPPTPLHVLLLKQGLPRDMYPRIVDLNRDNMPNPSFVSGDTRFYATG